MFFIGLVFNEFSVYSLVKLTVVSIIKVINVRVHITLFLSFCLCLNSLFGEIQQEVVILGSGPAGLTAAIYTSRAGLSTLVLEGDEPGGQIAISMLVENYPGFPEGINGYELGEKMREQARRFGAVIQQGKVVSVNLTQRPFILQLEGEEVVLADTLIIATGASVKWLGLESEKALIGKGVSTCATCDGFLFRGKEVVIVGGGNTALEDALFLTKYASKVTVIHRRDQLRASKYLQDKARSNPKIHFIWNTIVTDILDPQQDKVTGVTLKNSQTQETTHYPCQGVFVAIGHVPNTTIFKEQLHLDESGYVVKNSLTTETNIPGVFVAGDVADTRYRQAITAAGTGCMAGMDAYLFLQQHKKD
jgi:thioredoxin reductase (NADPH)